MSIFIIWYLSGLILGNLFAFIAWYIAEKNDHGVDWDGKPREFTVKITPFIIGLGILLPLFGVAYAIVALIAIIVITMIYLSEHEVVIKEFTFNKKNKEEKDNLN